MGYLFGSGQTDMLDTSSVTLAATYTLAVRFAFTTSTDAESRVLAAVRTATELTAQIWAESGPPPPAGPEKFNFLLTTGSGGAFRALTWDSFGFAAGSVHSVIASYDGSTMRIFADSDENEKSSVAEAGPVDQPVGATLRIGNDGGTVSANGTIYEVAWWPGTVLTGAQCRVFGLGYDAQFIRPKPSNHFRLINHARDHVNNTGANFTGAPAVAVHAARIFYPAPLSSAAPMAAFVPPSGDLANRRSSSSLGTRTGTRQAVEV